MDGDRQGRRRRRRGAKRRHVVQFSLDDGEYADLEETAVREGRVLMPVMRHVTS
ncbi:hypothetical protein ACFHYQ_08215 [Sphaerimonospora cavernae]|uniref:CopG family transcriptional regulator n=1 Tax=Sphaerimonospora cavernae TaxID=1740611 RepID=A0ABV6U1J3_9ACTN